MDFVSLAVLSTLVVNNYGVEQHKEKCIDTISLSALLKASQRLSSMTDIAGTICVTKGKFFSRLLNYKHDPNNSVSSEQEESKQLQWKQEGINAELIISLNIMLNMYVLQVYVQDKSNPSNVLHMGRRETQIKHTFYINYDLQFKYIDATSLDLSKVYQPIQNELVISSDLMKTIKNFVFCWKHTLDPDNLVSYVIKF
jgi:hypothetical protein